MCPGAAPASALQRGLPQIISAALSTQREQPSARMCASAGKIEQSRRRHTCNIALRSKPDVRAGRKAA